MRFRLPRLFAAAATIVCAVLAAAHASAQVSFPSKPVRIITPYPSGATDAFTRVVADRLSKQWGQAVIVEPKAGGAGIPAMTEGRDAAPDGYTLIVAASGPVAGNPALYPKLPYDPLKDYSMVGGMMMIPLVVVSSPDAPFRSIGELIDASRRAPGRIEYASPGQGTANHLTMELFKSVAGIDLLHVPYKGPAQAMTDVMSGRVKSMVIGIAPALPLIKAGKLRPIAVTMQTRFAGMPDVPTVAEAGFPGFEGIGWGGLALPAGTPAAIVEKIGSDVRAILRDPAISAQMIESGLTPDLRDAREFREFVRLEIDKWAKVARFANVKID